MRLIPVIQMFVSRFLPFLLLWVSTSGGLQAQSPSGTEPGDSVMQLVQLTTDYGEIVAYLYENTPQHRENFLKLVREDFYDSTQFHRVIPGFMIQGGDPNTKTDEKATYGQGGPGYTIPAEITGPYYHKRGALSAARQSDQVNPERRSSGSQFYIVHGRTFQPQQLQQQAQQVQQQQLVKYIQTTYLKSEQGAWAREVDWQKLQREDPDSLRNLNQRLVQEATEQMRASGEELFQYTGEQKETYATEGGAPHLDGSYTVFGEVLKGMDVVDKIVQQPTESPNRPVEPIRMDADVLELTPAEVEQRYGLPEFR